ncbi:hypothetical protein B0T18DRAFT_427758 [Schizothecium vesticola]|uniref:Protein kinase domain-containing protein n=1 Tax=Schizothecium vesticola TaxID=314040 RepID=A0AA40F252_9PEZI|nr:hypothetical protein B0T18DRAFT_427758 [Schizothecium vesticola]
MVTGLEILGGVGAAVGLAEKLLGVLTVWRSLAATRKFGKEMSAIAAKISMEYYRFMVWAKASRILENGFSDESGDTPDHAGGLAISEPLDDEYLADRLQSIVYDAITQVETLLADISKLTERYATPETRAATNLNPALLPSAVQEDSVSPATSAVSRNKARAEMLQRHTSFRLRFTFTTKPWDEPDKAVLQEKLRDLAYWNGRLEKLLASAIRESVCHHGLAAHVLADELKDASILTTLIEAAKSENEGVRTHATLWKERIILGQQESTRVLDVEKYQKNSSALTSIPSLETSRCSLSLTRFQPEEAGNSPPVLAAVEWYSYVSLKWQVSDVAIAISRLAGLIQLSSTQDKPEGLHILGSSNFVQGESSLALVYPLPRDASPTKQPVSLRNLLEQKLSSFRRPDLDDRLQLAQHLATTVYSLALIRWFHKDFSSRNVVFFRSKGGSPKNNPLLSSPHVVGFSISRPEAPGEKSLNKDLDALDIYLHPDLRVADAKDRPEYHRKYDIYSLGLVLYEVGAWMPIDAVADKSLEPVAFKEKVVDRCRKDLAFYAGRAYRDVVLSCLTCGDEEDDEGSSSLDALYYSVVLEIAKVRW